MWMLALFVGLCDIRQEIYLNIGLNFLMCKMDIIIMVSTSLWYQEDK